MSDLDKLSNHYGPDSAKGDPNTSFWHSPTPNTVNVFQLMKNKNLEAEMQTKFNEIKRWILLMMGYPTIKVEINDEQLNQCIQTALNLVARYAGKTLYAYTLTKGGQAEYDWPSDAISIFDVQYKPAYLGSLGNVNQMLFSDFYLLATDLAVDIYESPVTFWNYLASREMLEKVYGVNGTWETIDNRRFRIHPTPIRDHIITVKYKSKDPDLDLTSDAFNLIRKLALAYAKVIIGRIRSKYAAIPGSGGGSMTLDGATLLAEAEKDEAAVMADLLAKYPVKWSKY